MFMKKTHILREEASMLGYITKGGREKGKGDFQPATTKRGRFSNSSNQFRKE